MSKRGITYRSYNFVNKDPVLDAARTVVQRSKMDYAEIHERGGPTASTLHAWFDGETRSPRFQTLAAAVRAAGGDVLLRDADGREIILKSRGG